MQPTVVEKAKAQLRKYEQKLGESVRDEEKQALVGKIRECKA